VVERSLRSHVQAYFPSECRLSLYCTCTLMAVLPWIICIIPYSYALCKAICYMSEHGARTRTGKPVYQRGNMLFTVGLYGQTKVLLLTCYKFPYSSTQGPRDSDCTRSESIRVYGMVLCRQAMQSPLFVPPSIHVHH